MDFWQKVIVQAAGPVISAFILGVVAAWIARMAQIRREQWSLRHELIGEMTKTASTLYNETLRFIRVTKYFPNTGGAERRKSRADLDKRYRASLISAEVIQDRLEAYFECDRARFAWHRTIDLLSMRYFVLVTEDEDVPFPPELIDIYSGDEHTGLTVETGLFDLQELRNSYHCSRKEAANAVLRDPFVGDWVGLRESISLLTYSRDAHRRVSG